MKKRSIWILALSALLCLSILFSACSPAESEGESEGDEYDVLTETEDVPQDEVVDYSAILSEWSRYLKSVGTDSNGVAYDKSELLTEDTNGDNVTVSVNVHGTMAEVVKTEAAVYDSETGNVVIPEKKTTSFYDLNTNTLIFTKSQNSWNTATGRYDSNYSVNVLFDTIVEAISYQWSNNGTDTSPDWRCKTLYSYYMPNGDLIAGGLEKAAKRFLAVDAVEINNITYHCRDGKIIHTSAIGSAHAIPDFTKEYGGYKYSVGNRRLQVHDGDYKLVVDYIIPLYILDNDFSVFVLSDGSVYFSAVEYCYENEEHYDYKTADGQKYRVWHVIVDLNGKETVIDAPFIISKASSIGGLISNFNTEETGIELLGDYQYAEIVRIEDGVLANDVDFVILDNYLKTVATLPKILKNQLSIQKGLEDNRFLVIADNILGTESRYVADAVRGTVTRFFNAEVSYTEIDGGYLFDGKVYGEDLKELYDFEDAPYDETVYRVYDGVIYFVETEYMEVPVTPEADSSDPTDTDPIDTTDPSDTGYDSEPDTAVKHEILPIKRHYIGYVDANGAFTHVEIGSGASVSYIGGGLFAVSTDEANVQIYNRRGEHISLGWGYSVSSLSVIAEYEGGIIVRAERTYIDVNGFEVVLGYAYYIVK